MNNVKHLVAAVLKQTFMKYNRIRIIFPVILLIGMLFSILSLTSCDAKKDEVIIPAGPNEPSVFTSSPVQVSKLNYILSLGWLQPVGHTIPTDHIYFWFNKNNGTDPIPVYASGNGVINQILPVPVLGVNECKVWIKMNNLFTYYLDHIVLDTSIKVGVSVKAGQVIGTTGIGNSIDMGAIDSTVTNAFINTARYPSQTVHCGKPLSYFTDPLKSQLYALVDREGNEKDGWVNVDVPKTLSGNWFLDGSVFYTDGPNGWDKELSFAYDIQHPAKLLVSIGGTVGMVGKWTILPSAIPPSQVTTASGKVAYTLWSFDPNYPSNPGVQRGLMIVQMTDDTHIKVEVFPDVTITDASFTSNAKIYAR